MRSLPVTVIWLLALMLFNLLQICSILVLPFSRRLFRTINTRIAATWWGGCVALSRAINNQRVEVSGDTLPQNENAVVMLNHQSMSDIPVLLDLAYNSGRLRDLKWYVKDILKFVPGIGWGMLFLDCLFIKRDWTADKDLIHRVFKGIVAGKVPVWIVSFLEGTRITPAKVKQSQDYAGKRGLPILNHVLIPRTKGLIATMEGLQNHVHAVYDITIGYVDAVPTLGQYTVGYSPRVHVHIQRIAIADLPTESDQLSAWVMNQYVAKDKRLERYYQSGSMLP
jgi:1-acyl-sn-glycerol-3-phosphate acyltransferase